MSTDNNNAGYEYYTTTIYGVSNGTAINNWLPYYNFSAGTYPTYNIWKSCDKQKKGKLKIDDLISKDWESVKE